MRLRLRSLSRAYSVYLLIECAYALFFGIYATMTTVYRVVAAHLNPLQLVLVGTVLEGSIFLCQLPTGVLADTVSRRLSVILGVLLIGSGFLLEGSFTYFPTILCAQALWGIGYTFVSGAEEAWLADEIGTEAAGQAAAAGGGRPLPRAWRRPGADHAGGRLQARWRYAHTCQRDRKRWAGKRDAIRATGDLRHAAGSPYSGELDRRLPPDVGAKLAADAQQSHPAHHSGHHLHLGHVERGVRPPQRSAHAAGYSLAHAWPVQYDRRLVRHLQPERHAADDWRGRGDPTAGEHQQPP